MPVLKGTLQHTLCSQCCAGSVQGTWYPLWAKASKLNIFLLFNWHMTKIRPRRFRSPVQGSLGKSRSQHLDLHPKSNTLLVLLWKKLEGQGNSHHCSECEQALWSLLCLKASCAFTLNVFGSSSQEILVWRMEKLAFVGICQCLNQKFASHNGR